MFFLAPRFVAIFAALAFSSEATAGWFGPNPAVGHYHQNIEVEESTCHNDTIVFKERGTYTFGAVLNPVKALSNNIAHPDAIRVPFKGTMRLKHDGRVAFSVDKELVLENHIGLNFGRARSPGKLPLNTEMILEICIQVDPALFKKAYGTVDFWVNKAAYWSVVD